MILEISVVKVFVKRPHLEQYKCLFVLVVLYCFAERFSCQHRYYGESMPYGSGEVAYKNATTLAHLTAEQALADFAVLITDLKMNLSAQASPVVLFGGSYGGSETFLNFDIPFYSYKEPLSEKV